RTACHAIGGTSTWLRCLSLASGVRLWPLAVRFTSPVEHPTALTRNTLCIYTISLRIAGRPQLHFLRRSSSQTALYSTTRSGSWAAPLIRRHHLISYKSITRHRTRGGSDRQ